MKNNVLLIPLSLLVGSLWAQTPPAKPPTPKLGSTVVDFKTLEAKPTKVGERRQVFDNPTDTLANLECHITTLKPGELSSPPHTHTIEEVTVINEGTLEVIINEKKQVVGAGSVFLFNPKDMTNMRNVGTTPATYTVFQITTMPSAK